MCFALAEEVAKGEIQALVRHLLPSAVSLTQATGNTSLLKHTAWVLEMKYRQKSWCWGELYFTDKDQPALTKLLFYRF